MTTRVSFYPLRKGTPHDTLLFVCRLVDKAVQRDRRVHLLARDLEQMKQLDELLWQFTPESFIPHQCLDGQAEDAAVQVTLGTGEQLPDRPDVLINLSQTVWDQHDRFPDIREVVGADEAERALGRQRYRHYQDLGYTLETMQLPGGRTPS